MRSQHRCTCSSVLCMRCMNIKRETRSLSSALTVQRRSPFRTAGGLTRASSGAAGLSSRERSADETIFMRSAPRPQIVRVDPSGRRRRRSRQKLFRYRPADIARTDEHVPVADVDQRPRWDRRRRHPRTIDAIRRRQPNRSLRRRCPDGSTRIFAPVPGTPGTGSHRAPAAGRLRREPPGSARDRGSCCRRERWSPAPVGSTSPS